MAKITDNIIDSLSSVWKLLSDTEAFVSCIPEYFAYEIEFRYWRKVMQTESRDSEKMAEIKREIITLRKELRLRGYDLTLGSLRLKVDGYKNDDAMGKGYQRLALCFSGGQLYALQGEANHIQLGEELDDLLSRKNLLDTPEYHFVWFLRTADTLYISGAATEPEENFKRLQSRAEANPYLILSSLKNLR